MQEAGSNIVTIASPNDLLAFDRSVMFLERQNIGHNLARVRTICQAIYYRNRSVLRQLQQSGFIERADHDHVHIS